MFKYIGSIWLTMALSSLLAITDYLFLGHIDHKYYAIVGVAAIPFTILSALLVGFGIEVNRQVSSGNQLNLAKVTLLALSVCGVLVATVNSIGEHLFFYISKDFPMEEVRGYFSWLSLSAFPLVVIFIGAGVFRGEGQAVKQIPFSIVAVLLNAVFDFIFIKGSVGNSPIIGCALATVLADTIVAILYFAYFFRTGQLSINKKLPNLFVKNTTWASLDKLFSVGSLFVVSQFFVSMMPIVEASLYFAFQVFLMPFTLWSHSYFEWVIHRKAQGLKYTDNIFSITTVAVFLSATILLASLIKSEFQYAQIFALLYFVYLGSFWKEREYCGSLFSDNRGNVSLTITAIQKVVFSVGLLVLFVSDNLGLIAFISLLSFTMIVQNFFLRRRLACVSLEG